MAPGEFGDTTPIRIVLGLVLLVLLLSGAIEAWAFVYDLVRSRLPVWPVSRLIVFAMAAIGASSLFFTLWALIMVPKGTLWKLVALTATAIVCSTIGWGYIILSSHG